MSRSRRAARPIVLCAFALAAVLPATVALAAGPLYPTTPHYPTRTPTSPMPTTPQYPGYPGSNPCSNQPGTYPIFFLDGQFTCSPQYPGYPGGYPNYPGYPGGYPNYPQYPTTPPTCPAGQVGNYPTCHVVDPPKEEPGDPTPTTPTGGGTPGQGTQAPQGDAGPSPVPSTSGKPSGNATQAPPAKKPTLAFKGKVKVTKKGAFSVACVATAAPAGASCRLRVIVGSGKVIGTVRTKVTGDAARLRITLTKRQLRKVPKSRKLRVALDLVGPKGDVVLTTRASVKLPR